MRLRRYTGILALVFFSIVVTAQKPKSTTADKNHSCCKNAAAQHTPTQQTPPDQQGPHAPGAGVTECHNYDDKSKKIKADCPCWGQYAPDYDKCKPPSEEDKKCRNYCKSTFCKCKVKCQS